MLTNQQIQDWWNTLDEEGIRKVYEQNCKHDYRVRQSDEMLVCRKCENTLKIDVDTFVFNYMDTIKECLNEA